MNPSHHQTQLVTILTAEVTCNILLIKLGISNNYMLSIDLAAFLHCVQASVVYIRSVIVIHDTDKLSSDLQHYIGWFLGRYAGCNKIIFCGSDASNLEAIKHLCKVVTLQLPSFDEVLHYTTC